MNAHDDAPLAHFGPSRRHNIVSETRDERTHSVSGDSTVNVLACVCNALTANIVAGFLIGEDFRIVFICLSDFDWANHPLASGPLKGVPDVSHAMLDAKTKTPLSNPRTKTHLFLFLILLLLLFLFLFE